MSAEYRIEHKDFEAFVRPVETRASVFMAEVEIADVGDHTSVPALARSAGIVALELMQTSRYADFGGPYQAVSVIGLPAFSPTELVDFSTGGSLEAVDSLRLDYGLPGYMLATEDPDGHVHSLYPSDYSHLPDSPGGWHTDLTFMPNRPTRTTLQANAIGTTLRVGSRPGDVRSTFVADGRWIINQLQQAVRGSELDLDFDRLLTTELYSDSFDVDYEHLRGKPLTSPATHPRIVVSPTRERALTIRSFRNAHYGDGPYLSDGIAARLDELVLELLSSDGLPKYEHQHKDTGSILIISDRTPHHRGRAPHKETELRRVCTYNKQTYVPQFVSDEVERAAPAGYIQPASILNLEREDYMVFKNLATNRQLGDLDVATVERHFKGRCTKFLRNITRIVQDHPEINLESECVGYASKKGIPGIASLEDFLKFSGVK